MEVCRRVFVCVSMCIDGCAVFVRMKKEKMEVDLFTKTYHTSMNFCGSVSSVSVFVSYELSLFGQWVISVATTLMVLDVAC